MAARTMSDRPHRARKRFGQHFLEPAWAAKVIAAIDPHADDLFVEIGPGHGALTGLLAARARRVVAFEIDRDLAAELRRTAPSTVDVIAGDFLAARVDDIAGPGNFAAVRVAGNLPYNVASPILFKLIELRDAGLRVEDVTVMLQREVADRLLAVPETKDYGVLTVLIQHRADVTRVLNLPPGAFRPAPKVRSTVVRLNIHPPSPAVRNPRIFSELVKAVFTRRRKTLANALAAFRPFDRARPGPGPGQSGARPGPGPGLTPGVLAAAGLDGRRRPETLTVAEFARLADLFAAEAD